MHRQVRPTLLVVLFLVGLVTAPPLRAQAPAAAPAATQCSLSWVGQESEIEEFLKTAKVVKLEQVPIGVTKPLRADFEPGSLVRRAAWKPLPPSFRTGYHESYKAELAAYALDRLLDMHQVPPVVERRVDGLTGAMIYWIEGTKPWDVKKPPQGPGVRWAQQVSRMRLFDQLIANIDRNAGNLLYDEDWHLFLIDHSRAFTERKDINGVTPPARVEKAYWARIEALTPEQVQPALSPWLTKGEIDAIFTRRDRMRQAIEKMVKARGEANVFF